MWASIPLVLTCKASTLLFELICRLKCMIKNPICFQRFLRAVVSFFRSYTALSLDAVKKT